jgi:predicted component of type VI protein secretion system
VIQRTIEFGSELQQTAIYDVVYQNYDELAAEPYARHVISRLEDQGFAF